VDLNINKKVESLNEREIKKYDPELQGAYKCAYYVV
jgi:hypothetical protein